MKCITLTQPYATLMASGAKMIETRSWRPNSLKRGQWIAIHAAKGLTGFVDVREFCELCISEPFKSALGEAHQRGILQKHDGRAHLVPADLPRGAVVAVARFDLARLTEQVTGISAEERAFGNYSHGRWAWIFDKVEPLPVPIPASGALYLWDWTQPAGFALGEVGARPVASLWESEADA